MSTGFVIILVHSCQYKLYELQYVYITHHSMSISLAPWRNDNAHLSLKLVTGSNVVGGQRIPCAGVVVGTVIP